VDRILVVTDSPERLLGHERLADVLASRPGRRVTLTVAAPSDPAGLRSALAELAPAAGLGPDWDIRVAAPAGPVESLLADHQALVPVGAADDGRLIIRAWQRGLCVVNSPEQARRIAGFSDDYHDDSVAKPWFSVMEGDPVVVTNPQRITLDYGARINPRAVIHNESEIRIGRGSLLGADAELNLFSARFVMGQFCHTSSYLAAIGSRHTLAHPSTFAVSRGAYAFLGEPADKVADIVIGNDVWIAARVMLMPGVQVADGCVVGAGSVVTKSLTEPYGIYAGNPARLLRFRFPPHVVKWLCGIQWWSWPTRRLWEARRFFATDIADKSEEELWRLIER
jgi:acetyltransferase-like isoleucine patch superfamily enzyme